MWQYKTNNFNWFSFQDFESERSSVSQSSQSIEMNGINGNVPNGGSVENGTLWAGCEKNKEGIEGDYCHPMT